MDGFISAFSTRPSLTALNASFASFNPHLDLNKKHLDVRGCWGSEFSHFYRAAQLVAERGKAWTQMKLISYGLTEANEALADVADGRVLKALIRP